MNASSFKDVIRRNAKFRWNAARFKALIESPAVDQVVLPANGRLGISNASGAAAGTTALTITASTNKTIKVPLLEADEIAVIDYAEKGSVIDIEPGFKLFVDVGLNKFQLIGQGS